MAKPDQEDQIEDASELRFPKEFETAKTLLNSEVYMLLEARKAQNEAADDEAELPPIFLKTHVYTHRFSVFKNRDTIVAVRHMLSTKDLHQYELASLANILPESADEAKALIPSLDRFNNDELQELLDDMKTKKSFQA
ncbi:DNA-directed RNA polymerase II subunit RPB4-like [Paramacrobiotus metropolitanus]|uniref:DNA-directed RNA polymerase II subunit RPB4-like n=1 Tax=Paramacrobiotus metropolitanus TaxID=2943436 RepID=UPI002446560A|nr:DNA-directed RNA polymerase II subunit RPB4-like [Paramacrobiotus metropolitanus]